VSPSGRETKRMRHRARTVKYYGIRVGATDVYSDSHLFSASWSQAASA
jgi:hypothetical protein